MSNTTDILKLQKKQNSIKKEIKEIRKKTPFYLIGFIFILFLIVFLIEDKVYTFFNGVFNFIITSVIFGFILCFVFVKYQQKQIREKEKSSRAIGANLYRLMKLENE